MYLLFSVKKYYYISCSNVSKSFLFVAFSDIQFDYNTIYKFIYKKLFSYKLTTWTYKLLTQMMFPWLQVKKQNWQQCDLFLNLNG